MEELSLIVVTGHDNGEARRRNNFKQRNEHTLSFPRQDVRPSDAVRLATLEIKGAGKAGCQPHPRPRT